MQTDQRSDDIQAIEALVARQFASLDWTPGTTGNWAAFATNFFPEASLHSSTRLAKRQSVEGVTLMIQAPSSADQNPSLVNPSSIASH